MEIFTSKDVEGLLESIICKLRVKHHKPIVDEEQVYYVLQGPTDWMNKLIHANCNRPKVAIGCDPNNWNRVSWVYFSNTTDIPHHFRVNIHYGKDKSTPTSNRLGYVDIPIPDFGRTGIENKVDTCFDMPDKSKIDFMLRKGDF